VNLSRRWRKLEGSDPTTYDLIQKVQLLQRRLIKACEKVVERDLQIREKEQLCHQLQAIVRRAPGEEAGEKLLATQVCRCHLLLFDCEPPSPHFKLGDLREEVLQLAGHQLEHLYCPLTSKLVNVCQPFQHLACPQWYLRSPSHTHPRLPAQPPSSLVSSLRLSIILHLHIVAPLIFP